MKKEKNNGDFPFRNAKKIALIARYICQKPDCRTNTLLLSNYDNNRYIIIGEAAHIIASTLDGPRGNSDLPFEERKNISNGIWLCRNCHKMIDANSGIDYPIDILYQWKY
jgi:hypothetical protein